MWSSCIPLANYAVFIVREIQRVVDDSCATKEQPDDAGASGAKPVFCSKRLQQENTQPLDPVTVTISRLYTTVILDMFLCRHM